MKRTSAETDSWHLSNSCRELYTPLGWALVRAPILPTGTDTICTSPDEDSLLPGDPLVRMAVETASPDLAAALTRTRPNDQDARRIRGKLLRYLLRMSARPTPYGLFAGVGLVDWGSPTDLELRPGPPRTRTRPDMQWLLDFVARLEQDPDVQPWLRFVSNPAVIVRGGRAFLRNGAASEVTLRATAPVRRLLEVARTPVRYTKLTEELGACSAATDEKVRGLIDELLRQGILYSDLRPPLTGSDPASYVRDRLASIPTCTAAAERLTQLSAMMRAWDALPFAERPTRWRHLVHELRSLHPAAGIASAHLLQTDMALPLSNTQVHAEVGVEAARAGELLLRMSPHPFGPPHLADYRHAFEQRYGVNRQVPLLELLDPDFGLGPPPSDHIDPPFPQRDETLRKLAVDANRNQHLVVELSDEDLQRLETWPPRTHTAPLSMDISVFVASSSPAAIDAGDFQIVVGPNAGASAAGRNLGRFADLLGPGAIAALKGVAAAEDGLDPQLVRAEVVYTPHTTRLANVVIRPAVRTQEIVFATHPGVDDDHVVPVDELLVGVHAGRFTVSRPDRSDEQLVGMQGHMLSPMLAPAAVRFLLDVARDGRCELSPFDWGMARSFPFLPRLQYGRIVLALAQWRIDPAATDLPVDHSNDFPSAFESWRQHWRLPRHVYLTEGDNRLLLDTDDSEHVELLREELRKTRKGQSAVLQEALPGPTHAWLPGPEGGHLTEFIVPLALRHPPSPASLPHPECLGAPQVAQTARVRLPGSEWLYLKLYGAQPFQDELIAGPLRSFAEFAVNSRLCDGWYFLRYAEREKSHLRIRFHGDAATILGTLMRHVCAWATELVADGMCTAFAFDTYEREVERYGGEHGIRAAESIFTADSPVVAEMLRLSCEGKLPFDMTTLAVLTLDDLLTSLGMNEDERTGVYRDAADPRRHDGQEYRSRARELRQLLGRPSTLSDSGRGQALAALLDVRRSALAFPAALLTCLEHEGLLHRPRSELCLSYLHLHANRLGMNRSNEQLALGLLRRTREGLNHAPSVGSGAPALSPRRES
ncbi:lantibiotic dehydratase [Streptomyces sp. NPDC052811]|uniref:lantibiotic dehydratase n=1 Tax=Streptomyces sp. NPDC052811 TaxID=3155731 RepID=UPI0034288356